MFSSIYKSDHYKKYVSNEDLSVNIDKRFFSNLLNQYILNNKLVVHILEEKSIFWVDDLPFIAAIVIGEIKSNDHINFKNIFKDDSDEKFAIQLLIDTINNTSIYDEIIEKHSENWDLDRIAFMDKLFLKMAFTELLYMNSLPIKVTLNEYIEISKYYSTSKSKIFVNGKNFQDYFTSDTHKMQILRPFEIINQPTNYDVKCNVIGGGLTGQVGALVHGISKALLLFDAGLKPTLKKEKLTTRDSRTVERKKYGHRKARRSFQFSKR